MSATTTALLLLLASSLTAGCALADGEPRDRPAADGFLDVVLEVTRAGEARLVAASEVAGPAEVPDLPKGDFTVEVSRGEEVLWVESIGDPFEAHSFGGPGGEGHHFEAQEWGTLHVRIPGAARGHIDPGLVIRLLRIEEAGTVYRVNAATLADLGRQGRLEEIVRVSGEKLTELLREK